MIANPFAGRYVEDIRRFMDDLQAARPRHGAAACVDALGGDPKAIEGYGKGAIVGAAGELEHGALWHVPGGYAMRELLGDAKAIVPSTKKVGGPGTRLDVPITHINASYVRSHFDAIEVGVADAPARRRDRADPGDDDRRRASTRASAASRPRRSRARTACDESRRSARS